MTTLGVASNAKAVDLLIKGKAKVQYYDNQVRRYADLPPEMRSV